MANDIQPLLQVKELGRQAPEGMVSVRNVSFAQQPLEKLAIAGETGCGKSTLLKMIGGFVQPSSGSVWLGPQRVKGPEEQLIAGHKSIAYLSQHFELRNNYRVHEVLAYSDLLTPQEIAELSAVCRIEHLLQRRTTELSGGEKQRVALAKLLTTQPQLLLLDEPFSNLDLGHKSLIQSVITDVSDRLATTCLMVSHDAADILSWADTLLVMKDGEIVQRGTPEQVYYQPANEYCATLLGPYNKVPAAEWAHAWPAATDAQHLMIRPEHLQLAEAGQPTVAGTVQASRFHGTHHTSDILVNGQGLLVNTGQQRWAVGDAVQLAVTGAWGW
jgi:ABC-type sugar transport system ATPase subunit